MTVFKICAIRDTVAEAWMRPMFFQSTGQAIRALQDEVVKVDSEFGKHPEDYHMFLVGEWDDETGEVRELLHDKVVSALALKVENKDG